MLETLALMGHGFVNAMSLSNLLFIFVLCRLPLQRMCLIDTQRRNRQHKTAQYSPKIQMFQKISPPPLPVPA